MTAVPFRTLDGVGREFFAELVPRHRDYRDGQWKQIVWSLEQLGQCGEPWPMAQLHHALLCADIARSDGASDELVLCALCHDVGKIMGYEHHGEISAGMLRPYVSDASYRVVKAHQDFEAYHIREHAPQMALLREAYKHEPWYELAIQFAQWDQAAFDASAKTSALGDYVDLIKQLCAKPAYRVPQLTRAEPAPVVSNAHSLANQKP